MIKSGAAQFHMQQSEETRSQVLKSLAKSQGFSFCGIARAEALTGEARLLEQWLHAGKHGTMQYMENHFDKRIDPRKLVPGAKSVISLMYNYHTKTSLTDETHKISQYAFGEDYHHVLKDKMRALMDALQKTFGDFHARIFTDSAPVLEKAWARRSGIGWQGKNTNIIHPKAGSYFFLAEIICDLALRPDAPLKDYCGSCTACTDACPTGALDTPYVLDASKCISYLTIELNAQTPIPENFRDKMEGWIFGCDICQQVCPWNRFSTEHAEPRFTANSDLRAMQEKDWVEITEEVFNTLFEKSAVQRTGYAGLRRNIRFLVKMKNHRNRS